MNHTHALILLIIVATIIYYGVWVRLAWVDKSTRFDDAWTRILIGLIAGSVILAGLAACLAAVFGLGFLVVAAFS